MRLVRESGLGVVVRRWQEIPAAVASLHRDPARLASCRARLAELPPNRAVFEALDSLRRRARAGARPRRGLRGARPRPRCDASRPRLAPARGLRTGRRGPRARSRAARGPRAGVRARRTSAGMAACDIRQGRLAEEWMLPKLTVVEKSRRARDQPRRSCRAQPVSKETTAPAPRDCALEPRVARVPRGSPGIAHRAGRASRRWEATRYARGLLPVQAHGQRLHPPQEQERSKGPSAGALGVLDEGDLFRQPLVAHRHRRPAVTSPCPARYLVAEWTTMSAPSSSGRWRYGLRAEASTPSQAPWRVGQLGEQLPQVGHAQERVGQRLHVHQPRARRRTRARTAAGSARSA